MSHARHTLSAAHYRDAPRYEAERRHIFLHHWLFMGHESQLTRPGDVIAAEIGGFPLLVVRAEEGLRAFHNVCRHRAGPLFDGTAGNCGAALTCKYHGWSYTLDGRLRMARDFGPASNFDPRDFSLLPLRVESWAGFVFVSGSAASPPLAQTMAPLSRRMDSAHLSGLVHAGAKTHDIACNWKVYAENYLEGYHIPSVHPRLDAEIDSARYAVSLDGDFCFHKAPLRVPAQAAVYDGLWGFLWPNLGVNVYGSGLMMERIVPMGLNQTRLVYDYFLKPSVAANEAERAAILSMSGAVTAEDKWICEKVQTNIAAGVYDQGMLSPRHEAGVYWFQTRVAEALS